MEATCFLPGLALWDQMEPRYLWGSTFLNNSRGKRRVLLGPDIPQLKIPRTLKVSLAKTEAQEAQV